MNKTRRKQGLFRGLAAVMALLLTVSLGAKVIADSNSSYIDNYFGTTSQTVTSDPDASFEDLYNYTSDYTTATELVDSLIFLGRQVSSEGSVLLKNDGFLPFTSLFCLMSIRYIVQKYGGAMSVGTEDNVFALNIVIPIQQGE